MSTRLFERTLRPNVAVLGALRHEVDDSLRGAVSDAALRDIVLVVSELCTNAMQASPVGDEILVRIKVESAAVVVEVEDGGVGFSIAKQARAADHVESGRGLEIAKAVADDVVVKRRNRRTCVRARLGRNEALELAGDFKQASNSV